MGSWGRENLQQGGHWRGLGEAAAHGTGSPTFALQINWEEQGRSETDPTTQGSSSGK